MLKTLLISLVFLSTTVFADEFFEKKTEIGGYGELHFNHKNPEKGDASNKLDFHRFVTFISHNWTDKWSFTSEIELEHNFVKAGHGELELEQAYVSYKLNDAFQLDVGVLLPRAGFLNETHEPPTFLSTERNSYHKYIIPTTWFGNGMAIKGNIASQVDYKLTLMEGFKTSKVTAESGLRGARQKGFKADANTLLMNLAVDYTGYKGLIIGASYTRNQKVGNLDEVFDGINLIEAHARYTNHGVYITGEFGMITYNEGDLYKDSGLDLEASMGFYVEAGYDIGQFFLKDSRLYPWVAFTQYNTASSTKAGGDSEKANKVTELAFGLTFLPIEEISFKVDYTMQTKGVDDVKTTLINLGVGYMF